MGPRAPMGPRVPMGPMEARVPMVPSDPWSDSQNSLRNLTYETVDFLIKDFLRMGRGVRA